MDKLLSLLEHNSHLCAEDLADMLGKDAAEVKAAIDKYENDGTILGYHTLINWDKTDRRDVTALLEVRVTPSKGEGFDAVAKRIADLPEVQDVILVSGSYDIMVTVNGKTLQDIALFVSEKLSSMESVLSIATHFTLKKYKSDGVLYTDEVKDERAKLEYDGL